MRDFIFELQRFAEVVVGKANNNKLNVEEDKTQVYGLAGNDTLTSNRKANALLIGGSGDDVLNMTGGNGTLSGGAGNDTFNLVHHQGNQPAAADSRFEDQNAKLLLLMPAIPFRNLVALLAAMTLSGRTRAAILISRSRVPTTQAIISTRKGTNIFGRFYVKSIRSAKT